LKSVPRILPLVGVAIGGVLAVNALAGARDLPSLLSGAQAFAEEAVKTVTPAKDDKAAKDPAKPGEKAGAAAATGEAKDAVAAVAGATVPPKAVCAPTAAELAKQAGLSPAELQVLQSLGTRRGQLDKREDDLSTQLALMAAAEAKLDAKIKTLNSLKGDVQGLLTQSSTKEAAEIDRLVKVFEGMKAKDAAPRMVLLDDNVRTLAHGHWRIEGLFKDVSAQSPRPTNPFNPSAEMAEVEAMCDCAGSYTYCCCTPQGMVFLSHEPQGQVLRHMTNHRGRGLDGH
jgi:flagellar motility protein MotE (MotC chaperone)